MTKRILLVVVLAVAMIAITSGIALAAGQGTVIPHGGYDMNTDACLQCHDVHESTGDYVLTRWATVTATCGSCHYLYDTPPSSSGGSAPNTANPGVYNATPLAGNTPAYDPGYIGDETRTVSPLITSADNSLGSRISAYDISTADALTAPGHNLGRGSGLHQFVDGQTRDANYIPGGWDELTAIARGAYPNTVPATSFTGTNGLFCTSCHTPHGDFGQRLLDSLGNPVVSKRGIYNMLTSKPNHAIQPISIDDWNTQGGTWCEGCHAKRAPEAQNPTTGEIYHNHPDAYCLNCHGNYVGSNPGPVGGSDDFPHTTEQVNLLSNEPDALCITCHAPGTLP